MHTTLLHQDGDRSVAVYYYRCDVTDPSNDGDCNVDISCVDRGGCRALWNATISHIDALPPALALLGAAVNADH